MTTGLRCVIDQLEGLMPRRTAVSDNNLVLDYFRLSADHRLLFGAGETCSATVPRNLVERMRKRMVNVFPQLEDLAIDHAWGGFVDITANRAPHFGRIYSRGIAPSGGLWSVTVRNAATSTIKAVHLRRVWPDVARQLTIAMEVTGMEAGRFAGLAQILRSAC